MTDTNNRWIYGVCAVGLLVLCYGLLMLRSALVRRRIVSARRNETVESFIREFEGTRWSKPILEMAYEDLAKLAQMPVRRTDDLEKTLGVLPEDFGDMLASRCRKLGLSDVEKSSHAALFPLKTAEDYVRFLSEVMAERRNQSAEIDPPSSQRPQ